MCMSNVHLRQDVHGVCTDWTTLCYADSGNMLHICYPTSKSQYISFTKALYDSSCPDGFMLTRNLPIAVDNTVAEVVIATKAMSMSVQNRPLSSITSTMK